MEDRTLLSTFLVNTTADSGPGSLRQAILDSNAAISRTNTIDFAIPGQGVQTIAPISPLPAITNFVLIDGFSQAGYGGTPIIELSGSQEGSGDGLTITGAGVTVRGLDINTFSQGAGIHITGTGATNDWVYGIFAGTDPTGTQSEPNYSGVAIDGGASNNLVGTNGDGVDDVAERNLLSGNLFAGLWITGQGTTRNSAAGNWIGTDISGSVVLNNGTQPVTDPLGYHFGGGVAISAGASDNWIGTDGKSVDDVGERNVIAGSGNDGVDIYGTGTDGNIVAGNFIGTEVTETQSSAIAGDGVFLAEGASSNWIGVNPAGGQAIQDEGNVISGNGADGVQILSSANFNVVAGNQIGMGVSGIGASGNSSSGVELDTGCIGTTIGGTAAGAGNVICANGNFGVWITGAGAMENLVQGNTIGTEITGSVLRGNTQGGVQLDHGAANNTIGGLTTAAGVFHGFDFASGTSSADLSLRSDISGPPQQLFSGGPTSVYHIDVERDGMLLAIVHTQGFTPRLMMLDSQGRSLVQSDGLSPGDSDSVIDQHLAAGSYSLVVESTGGAGTYTLTTTLSPASAPLQPIPVGSFRSVIAADFNDDGHTDLVVANFFLNTVSVLLGNGDGTFQPPVSYPVGNAPNAIVSGDFKGDGLIDLAVANSDDKTVSVLLGNGDGTFQPQVTYSVGTSPDAMVAGDFNGDRRTDLAVVNSDDNTVSVLMGNGNGTFQPQVTYWVGTSPDAIVACDFNGDGHTDLAVVNAGLSSSDGTVSVLLGIGNGTFQPQVIYQVGASPDAIVSGNFNGDGRVDLAVANGSDNTVSVFLGNGNGTFQPPVTYPVGFDPASIEVGDFNGDGRTDLATAETADGTVSVLLGNGNGTFQAPVSSAVGGAPDGVATGDFNGDSRTDLAVINLIDDTVSVLLGNGDGTFQAPASNVVAGPYSIATSDFNGDGRIDLAVVNIFDNAVSVLMSNGDGTFQPPVSYPVGTVPDAIVAGDFNGDGRTDLAVANADDKTVSVLLGNGDGTFQPQVTYPVGAGPDSIVAGDFNGDGRIDLAVANVVDNTVSVLLGNGDGTFQRQGTYKVGAGPNSIVAGDFNGHGRIDLAVANSSDNNVSVLLGNGNGTFQPQVTYPVGTSPYAIVSGDFNGDGRTDLATANVFADTVSVLLGNGNGTFQPQINYAVGAASDAIVSGDFNGDGLTDLAAANSGDNTVSVLLGNGDGTFQPRVSYQVGASPDGIVSGDFSGSGRVDLAVANSGDNTVSVLLGNGDGTFADAGPFAKTLHSTPVIADVNGDGTDDVLVVDAAGDILYRQGIPAQPGTFEAPITVNPPPLPGGSNPYTSRDIAWVAKTQEGPLLASVDAKDADVSLYAYRQGTFVRIGSLRTGQLPAQVIAVDLNGTGWDDLVVRNAGSGSLSVYYNAGDKTVSGLAFIGPKDTGNQLFGFPVTLPVGIGVSDVQAVDTTGDGRLDLVVTNKQTGQVSILLNLGGGKFAAAVPYRAGTGLSEIDPGSTPEVTSLAATVGVAAGPLTPGASTDLVTINPGSNTLDVLAGLGGGRFANPVTLQTQSPAQIIRMADFTGNGFEDLAVLTSDAVNIYLGNGKGGFLSPTTYAVPSESDGLTVADVNRDGNSDLLVGDAFGDVLVLLGNGNGTFQPYHEANQSIELAVAEVSGNGSKDIIYADQRLDRVVVDHGAGNSTVLAKQSTGLLDPGAVTLADLNGDRIPDLIVANSGSNNVLIYPGLGNGQFGPGVNGGNGYFVGTNPVGITVADLTGAVWPNGKPRLDLVVADKGSNDIAILLNQGNFSFRHGPRLGSGGIGPVSTVVGNFSGGTTQDILVTNSGSNNVTLLQGVGGGFFKSASSYSVGGDPVQSIVRSFDNNLDLLTVNAGSNDLTLISNFESPDPLTMTISSGGLDPETAFAFESSSGFEDLVVANTGDGVLALLEGGPGGLTLMSTQVEPDLPTPTALAFSALTGGQIQFYAATAGREAADLVSLNLAADTSFQVAVPGPSNSIAQLVPFEGSSVPLVAVVLTLTIEVSANELSLPLGGAENGSTGAFLAGSGITVGQSVLSAGQGGGSGEPVDADDLTTGGAGAAAAHAAALPWERFVLGLDQVLERFLRENPNGLSGAVDRSDRPGSPATPGSPAPGNPTGSPSAPAPPAQSGNHDEAQGSSAAETSQAVDSIIESLWKEDASSGQSGPTTGWQPALDPRIEGVPELRVVAAWETVWPTHELPSESNGFGNRRAMTLPLRGPGKDEPSLAAPLAFVALANEWTRWRLTSHLRRSHIRRETLTLHEVEQPPDCKGAGGK